MGMWKIHLSACCLHELYEPVCVCRTGAGGGVTRERGKRIIVHLAKEGLKTTVITGAVAPSPAFLRTCACMCISWGATSRYSFISAGDENKSRVREKGAVARSWHAARDSCSSCESVWMCMRLSEKERKHLGERRRGERRKTEWMWAGRRRGALPHCLDRTHLLLNVRHLHL